MIKNRLPFWFRQEIPDASVGRCKQLLSEYGINTVCQLAKCPNLSQCFLSQKMTFLILGETCTRDCRFCTMKKAEVGADLLGDEPEKIAELVNLLGLRFVVITSVTRDDLADGGAGQFAKTIEAVRKIDNKMHPVRDITNLTSKPTVSNGIKVEVLLPDFQGKFSSLKCVLATSPSVAGHNIETVQRLYKEVRPMANYPRSLALLKTMKEINASLITKSSLMLGMGEKEPEVRETMQDLRKAQCDILTLGQYLAPSKQHYPVKEFISPEQFQRYKDIGLSLGFKAVLSGPLVRSSYNAEEIYKEMLKNRRPTYAV
ncbi:MAG: lipoyl synthase [Candidatus Omnitrophica bacterium]|nr:lipoyl synthase [Candidatus Omnitrophota bacterium]